MLQESPEAKGEDSTQVEILVTPRKQVPKRDSIYRSLMERLHKTDSLLDFGEVQVQDFSASLPSYVSESQLAARQKLHLTKKPPGSHGKKRTLQIQRLGTLHSAQTSQDNKGDDEMRDDEVEQLLEKLQGANYVASGRKGFRHQKHCVFA